MVSLSAKVSSIDLARNYTVSAAGKSVLVRFSEELLWFRCRQKCPGAIQLGITMVSLSVTLTNVLCPVTQSALNGNQSNQDQVLQDQKVLTEG